MNKTKKILIVVFVMLIMVCGFIFYLIIPLRQNFIWYEPTRTAEEERVLNDISMRLGVESNWTAVREYVYCELLSKNMTRSDVENQLSQVGRIRFGDTEISFENQVLDYYLGPILVRFDGNGSSAKLQSWGSSPEHNFGAPRSTCEMDETK